MTRLWLASGDTVATYDVVSGRVTLFDASGELLDTRLHQIGELQRGVMGETPGGGVLAQRTVTNHGTPGTGLFRDSLEFVVVRDGEESLVLGPVPGSDRYLEGFPAFPVPFGLRATYRLLAGGRHLLVAPGDEPELAVVDLVAGTIRSVDVPLESGRVDDATLEALEGELEEDADAMPWDRRLIDGLVERGQVPAAMPAYAHAHVDREGWIWVQEFPVPGAPATYRILDDAGQERQRLGLPPSVPPHRSPLLAADGSTALFRAEDEVGTPLLLVMERSCRTGSPGRSSFPK